MKTLTIFRHAKSSWDDSDLTDFDRPLNPRGKRDAPEMGHRLKAAGIRPSLILTSPATRAWATARIVAHEIAYPIEFLQRERDLYNAGTNTLKSIICEQDDGFNSLMVIGHNPGLTDLVNELLPGTTNNLQTAAFVAMLIDVDTWDLDARQSAELIEYNFPKKTDSK